MPTYYSHKLRININIFFNDVIHSFYVFFCSVAGHDFGVIAASIWVTFYVQNIFFDRFFCYKVAKFKGKHADS